MAQLLIFFKKHTKLTFFKNMKHSQILSHICHTHTALFKPRAPLPAGQDEVKQARLRAKVNGTLREPPAERPHHTLLTSSTLL